MYRYTLSRRAQPGNRLEFERFCRFDASALYGLSAVQKQAVVPLLALLANSTHDIALCHNLMTQVHAVSCDVTKQTLVRLLNLLAAVPSWYMCYDELNCVPQLCNV